MDAQPNRNARRRRRRKTPSKKPAAKVEPIVVAARRPDSPRLEKPTRRMKAASARPRTLREEVKDAAVVELPEEPKKRREARIIQRKEDEVDDTERSRRKLFARYLASEGRAAVTRAANDYLGSGFQLPREQEAQLKLLEHFDEARSKEAVLVLSELIELEEPQQLHVFRQRLRRLEDHADDESLRAAAADLRRLLPA